jgi:S1-C subfamily serine protease
MKPSDPHKVTLLVGWFAALCGLLVIIALVANFGLGQSTIEAESGEHWKAAGEVDISSPTAGPGPGYKTIAAQMDQATVAVAVQRVDPSTGTAIQDLGSGFFVAQGYVLTNYHVVGRASSITVTTHTPTQAIYPATVAVCDASSDLAILRVQIPVRHPVVRRGDSDGVRAGDVALAVGNLAGFGNAFTSGVIADRRNNFSVNGWNYPDMFQTDITLNHGSSGGPLANASGEIVGVNTAIFAPGGAYTGIGFAIPINAARPLLEKLGKLDAQAAPATQYVASGSTPGISLIAAQGPLSLANPNNSRQALFVCPSCGTARYVRCPVCRQRLVLDAAGGIRCPAGHDVNVDQACPRCRNQMTTAPPGRSPVSLAV